MLIVRGVSALSVLLLTGGIGIAATPAPAKVSALKALEPGEWELRGQGDDTDVRRLCVKDLRQLLRLRHSNAQCRTFTVDDAPRTVSVTYDCAAAGNGRTDLRVETSHLVQIRSQGVADGAPFAFATEGRRIGACRG